MGDEARHGWNALEDYLHVLERVIEDDPFVIEHSLSTYMSSENGDISGDIVCHGDIIVNVLKYLEIEEYDGKPYARTVKYSYHARYEGGPDILRYDNAHTEGDVRANHKHDYRSGEEVVTDLGNDWPHLSDVLAELRALVWK